MIDFRTHTETSRITRCNTLCIYTVRYEWDQTKNLQNQQKHDGISFELAALVFETRTALSGRTALMTKQENNGGTRLAKFK